MKTYGGYLIGKEVCVEPRKEGFKDWQAHVERKKEVRF